MNAPVQIELLPLGQVLHLERGEKLQDVLFDHGVEFPCGGRGRCKGCKIRVLSGALPVTDLDESCLTSAERAGGWRLACRATAESDLQLEVAQWQATILSDNSSFQFTPRPGLGVAVDVGTTTLVVQLLDLHSGRVLAVRSTLNNQAKHGADIMSRIDFAVMSQGQPVLQNLIRAQIGQLITQALAEMKENLKREESGTISGASQAFESVVLVGNTVMHHLFSGLSVEPLSHYPFAPETQGLQCFHASELDWDLESNPIVYFLPCLGGFVGSDLLAGVLATKLHQRNALTMLIDLGTNGEIVLGGTQGMVCAATAAGPAFEGARIAMGMRAATGAISQVHLVNGKLQCHVIGNAPPRGICGSGLVDAAAACLDLDWIGSNGRMKNRDKIDLRPPVTISQRDIRELQLAKGAIAAGARMLVQHCGATQQQVEQVYLAGAFGNYINIANAGRIGLLKFPSENITPAGNTALLGAKLALFSLPETDISYPEIVKNVTHVSLHEVPDFQEVYAEEMTFP